MSGGFLPIAALAMQAGGQLIQGIGASKASSREAAAHTENARLALLSGEQDASTVRHDERMAAGEAIAGMAGAGGALGMGSALDIIEMSARNRERDIAMLRAKARGESRNHLQAAADAKAQGRAALIGGAFGAVATALSGAAQIRAGRISRSTVANEREYQLGRKTQLVLPKGR